MKNGQLGHMKRGMKRRYGLLLLPLSHCDGIPSGYFHLLCTLNLVVLRAALSFYPRPCPVPVSSDSLQIPAVLLSQWRIKVGSIKGKQGWMHSIAGICTLYLLAMANPCELDEAGDFLYVSIWGTRSHGAVLVLFWPSHYSDNCTTQ